MNYTGWAEKNGSKLSIIILVVWQLSSDFCLTNAILCDCDIEEKALLSLCISKWLSRETVEWKLLYFFVRDTEWVRPQTCRVVSHNRLRNQEAHGRWRMVQQTCKQWSKNGCGSWQLAAYHWRNCFVTGMTFEEKLEEWQSRNNSLSATVCTSVDTFAVVHALFDRVDSCARPTRFAISLTLCRNFHSIVSMRRPFKIHNNNKSFSSMSQSQSIVWVKQKPDDNCKTTRIVIKSIVQYFSTHPALQILNVRVWRLRHSICL